MQIVRCKMKVLNVTDHGMQQSVNMQAVYSNDPDSENKKYWDATPGGNFNMNYVNKNTEFLPGREYYIDVTLVPLPEPVQEQEPVVLEG
jgi:hypothetical protein